MTGEPGTPISGRQGGRQGNCGDLGDSIGWEFQLVRQALGVMVSQGVNSARCQRDGYRFR